MKKRVACSLRLQSCSDAKERRTNKELLSIKSKPTCPSMTRYFISRLRNNFTDALMSDRFTDFVNTWLQPGAESKETREPFQRLSPGAKPLKRFVCLRAEHRAGARS